MSLPSKAPSAGALARLSALRLRKVEASLLGGILIGLAVFLVASGVEAVTTIGTVAMVGVQAVAGLLLWRVLRPSASAMESIGMALAVGTALAAVVGSIAAPVVSWMWLAPTVLAMVFALVFARRIKSLPPGASVGVVEWWALGIGLVLGLANLAANLVRYPLSWDGVWGAFHPDMIFFEALSQSIARWGPWNSIFSPGEQVLYHWLAYGWSGQITVMTGAEPLVTLTRTLPYVSIVAGLLLVISWSRRLSAVPWVPALATILFLVGGHVGVVYGSALNFDSPSQSMSAVWILAWSMTFLFSLGPSPGKASLLLWLSLLGLLGGAVMLSKSSAGVVAVAASLFVVVAGILMRAHWAKQAILGFSVSGLGAAIAMVFFIWGSEGAGGINLGSLVDRASSVQGMNPIPGREGIIFGTALVVLAIVLRWASVPFLAVDVVSRRQPHTWLAFGFVIAAAGGVILFNGGQNELWFAAASVAPLAVLTSVAVACAWPLIGPAKLSRRRLILVGLATAVLTGSVWALWITGPSGGNVWQGTLRWAAPLTATAGALVIGFAIARLTGGTTALSVFAAAAVLITAVGASGRLLGVGTAQLGTPPTTRGEFFSQKGVFFDGIDKVPMGEVSSSLLEAGRIVGSFEGDVLIATNMTSSPDVPAFAGRQTLVSGTYYQAPYGPQGISERLLDRERQSWEFVDNPSESSLATLCRAGVDIVWIDPRRSAADSWQDWGQVLLETGDSVLLGILSRC